MVSGKIKKSTITFIIFFSQKIFEVHIGDNSYRLKSIMIAYIYLFIAVILGTASNSFAKSAEGFTISRGYETLIGEKGKTTTDLRPSGKVEIQGKTYQAFSHGNYIDKDEEILVDGIDENQLLVKKV